MTGPVLAPAPHPSMRLARDIQTSLKKLDWLPEEQVVRDFARKLDLGGPVRDYEGRVREAIALGLVRGLFVRRTVNQQSRLCSLESLQRGA